MELSLKFPPTPDFAHQHAELAVLAAKTISGKNLDYSPESVQTIDAVIEAFRSESANVTDVAATLFCFGCYLGEIMVRNMDGCWASTTGSRMESYSQWPIVIKMPNGDWWNPIGKVFKRFTDGPGEDLVYFFSLVRGGPDST